MLMMKSIVIRSPKQSPLNQVKRLWWDYMQDWHNVQTMKGPLFPVAYSQTLVWHFYIPNWTAEPDTLSFNIFFFVVVILPLRQLDHWHLSCYCSLEPLACSRLTLDEWQYVSVSLSSHFYARSLALKSPVTLYFSADASKLSDKLPWPCPKAI